ncbi:MAG: hypothetical protein ABIH23_29140, partial [bacterium]
PLQPRGLPDAYTCLERLHLFSVSGKRTLSLVVPEIDGAAVGFSIVGFLINYENLDPNEAISKQGAGNLHRERRDEDFVVFSREEVFPEPIKPVDEGGIRAYKIETAIEQPLNSGSFSDDSG